jgi:hypothetical protein
MPSVPSEPAVGRGSNLTPEFSSVLTTITDKASRPYRQTFFDLLPEVRLEIYGVLFKRKVVKIRKKDGIAMQASRLAELHTTL